MVGRNTNIRINVGRGSTVTINSIVFANYAQQTYAKNVFISFETLSGSSLAQLFLADVSPGKCYDVDISFAMPHILADGHLSVVALADRGMLIPNFSLKMDIEKSRSLCVVQ